MISGMNSHELLEEDSTSVPGIKTEPQVSYFLSVFNIISI